MEISLELVPRNEEDLRRQVAIARPYAGRIGAVNVPDLLRFPLRSWDACRIAAEAFPLAMPHLRAIDFDKRDRTRLAAILREGRFRRVLALTGDPPRDLSAVARPNRAEDLIRAVRAEAPGVEVLAGFDPYRAGFRDELARIDEKEGAGAAGFLSQPFFDMRLLRIYGELLAGRKVWFGLCPVTSERSASYWSTANRAVFPADFSFSMEHQRRLFLEAAEYCGARGFNLYLMPLRVDLEAYLRAMFG